MKKKINSFFEQLRADKKRTAIIVFLLLAGIFLAGKKFTGKQEEIMAQTAQAEKGTIVYAISASGNITSSNVEDITTQASGTVKKVYVNDGDQILAGQKIAEIDLDVQGEQNHASAYASYLGAVNSLKSAENSYRLSQASLAVVYDEIKGHETDETLQMKETRTRAEVANDNAYEALNLAKVRLNSAALDYKTNSPLITAPVAGVIKSVTVAEGMNIGAAETTSGARANQRVATIATGGLPIASFTVSEIDVSFIKPGQKATITLDALTDKTFTGKVVSVDRVGTITNNVTIYPVIIQLDTESAQILPNMAATAQIIIESKSDILIIPSAAISYQDNQALVTVKEDNQEKIWPLEVGISDENNTEVISGLSEGEVVVVGTVTTTSQTTGAQNGGGFLFGGAGGGEFRPR